MISDRKVYAMELHSEFVLNEGKLRIVRVPNGWIYTQFFENGKGQGTATSCFVPKETK